MAPQPVQLRRSKTAGNTPASLLDGEMAINHPDRLGFVADGSGVVRTINLTSDTEKAAATAPIGAAMLALTSGVTPAGYWPRRGQFIKALEAFQAGATSLVTAAIPSDPGDATNIAWNHTIFVTQAGTLAQFVLTTLGLTTAQLTTIISNARSVTE